nr:MAG TPA: hypothetical protein [Caudoviricetes sp.]
MTVDRHGRSRYIVELLGYPCTDQLTRLMCFLAGAI